MLPLINKNIDFILDFVLFMHHKDIRPISDPVTLPAETTGEDSKKNQFYVGLVAKTGNKA